MCSSFQSHSIVLPYPLSRVETQHHTIPAGFLAGADDPEALPSVWKYYTNPEGSRYFHKTSPLNVVTREDVFSKDPVAAGHIDDWSDMIMDMFQQETVALSYAYELFLEYDEDVLGCRYYIIDHSKRSVFWLESVSTEDLRMYSAWSTEHLGEYFILVTITPNRHPPNGVFFIASLWDGRDVLDAHGIFSIPSCDPHQWDGE